MQFSFYKNDIKGVLKSMSNNESKDIELGNAELSRNYAEGGEE